MQWASSTEHGLFGARNMDFVNPVRALGLGRRGSPRAVREVLPRLSRAVRGIGAGAKIYFTPQPLFEAVTTQWAATLQQMVAKEVPVDEGLDQLAASVDEQLKQAGLG